MVKLMEIKLPWTGPNLRVKVALGVVVEAEAALEDEVVAEEAEEDLVAEAGEALEGEAASGGGRGGGGDHKPQGKKTKFE